VTFAGIPFLSMSHALPEPLQARLQSFVSDVDETLQARIHTVGSAMDENRDAFGVGWVESRLTRAVIVRAACSVPGGGFHCQELGNGGLDVISIEDGVERRFRLRSCTLDAYGRPVVTVSSDSLLNLKRADPTLFGDHSDEPPPDLERWVIAYVLSPFTRTFARVYAARVIDTVGSKSPFHLVLADIVEIAHIAPLPPGFKGGRDDLDFPDEDEGLGEPGE
jgi:hypothetical protein